MFTDKELEVIVIDDKPIAYFDVDDTLVMWDAPDLTWAETVEINGMSMLVHQVHVDIMKKHKARGHTIVVWSQGGSEWAEIAIKALQLEDVVDLILPKPYWAYDDLPYDQALGERKYIPYSADSPSEPKPNPPALTNGGNRFDMSGRLIK